jgi:3-oxoacyl-[acyl-carrier protein] reductase
VDRDPSALSNATSEIKVHNDAVIGVACDVADPIQVDHAVKQTVASHGPIDILVNNAGIWSIKAYEDHSDSDMEQQWRVNFMGTHNFMTRVLPTMISRRTGSIINLSSIAAFGYTVPHVGYAASKAAVVVMTRDVGFEAAHHGVRVNGIAPGNISPTQSERELGHDATEALPMGRGVPSDIAGVVAFLASDDARFIAGVTIPVCGASDIWVSTGFDPNRAVAGKARQRA